MNLTPRHLAAALYTVIAVFIVATWYIMLTPWDLAFSQLEAMFAPDYENRDFFVWLAFSNFLTIVVAVTFWFKQAASYPLAALLFLASVGLLAWALWWSTSTLIFNYVLGCIFSIWSWWQPNKSFKRDCAKSRAAP